MELDGIYRVPAWPDGWGGNRDIWRSTLIFSRYHKSLGRHNLPAATRDAVLARDGRRCRYCGATERIAVDHITPACRDGTDDITNLAACCSPCNRAKADKPLDCWLSQKHRDLVWLDV